MLPQLSKHAGDRNRTSPFAFTGNKFEFRAVGSSQSISFVATVLNTVVAEAIDDLCTALEADLAAGTSLEEALRALIARELPPIKRIIFDGDNYSAEWHADAERRGLLNLRTTLDALERFTSDKNLALLEKYGVLSRREVESRAEIAYDQYFKTINIEGETMADLGRTMVLPAAIPYLNELIAAAQGVRDLGVSTDGALCTLRELSGLIDELSGALGTLVEQNAAVHGENVEEKAYHMRDDILPAMAAVRSVVDRLEKIVPDDLWPLPTYREMLFIK